MLVLPPIRKRWKCTDCKQEICQSTTEKYESGKYKILNAEDGVGGRRNEAHVCPERLQSGSTADKSRMRMQIVCARCKSKFYGVFVLCPYCFKVVCAACGHLRDWRLDRQRAGCPKCGHLYSDFIEISKYNPDIKKYVKRWPNV